MEKLNALRKQKIRAVILLEAVVALAIFASIATLLLGQIQKNRQEEAKILQKEEVLRVAKMALQTGQNQVNINGVRFRCFLAKRDWRSTMVQNSCWQSKSHKVKAFTLLESLLALLVISGGLLLFQAMSQLLISEVRYQQQSEQKEWLLFVDQLEAELDRSQFEKVEGNRFYMKQDGKDIAIGKSKSDDFRKTDASGRGYQPMVYGLKSAQITEDNQLVHFRFQFQKGLEREFIYRVEKEES